MNISNEAIALIPAKKAFENDVLPIKIEDNILHLGLPDKNNLKLINDLSFYTGYKIFPVEMPADVILKKIKEIYNISDFKSGNSNGNGNGISETIINESSNVETVNQIISNAIKDYASDIHFEILENVYRVRYRIDGHLREVLVLPKERSLAIASRLKIMANLDISEKRRPQDGKIRYTHFNNIIDIRVSTLPTTFGEKIVLRILNRLQVQLDLTKLGLNKNQLSILIKNIKLPYGMIIVTGPTGSGKTTTLYSALSSIHSIEKNILTIEDPIEYNLDGINQSNVKPEIGYDFASALRTFLRQDPDVIMVGEIRDKETAEIAIRASLTGHLVFSTLHTNDSASAITRLVNMGIEPFLIASSVRLIVAQRLVRKLCNCKTEISQPYLLKGENSIPSPSSGTEPLLKGEIPLSPLLKGEIPLPPLLNGDKENLKSKYESNGCEHCSYTGYKGRIALFELLEINEQIAEMISKNVTLADIRKKANELGYITLRNSGLEMINLGITTYEEVLRET